MREAPRGLVKWMRRRALPWAARALALAGVALLVAFGVGRVLTDQHHWSQYLWWMPAEWTVPAAWGLLGLSWALALASTRMGGALVRPFLLVGCLGATAWVGVFEWNLHRFVVPVRAGPDAVRVVHWNFSTKPVGERGVATLTEQDADVIVIANAPYGPERPAVRRAVAAADLAARVAGGAGEDAVDDAGDGRVRLLERGRVMVGSRFPITRYGVARLDKLDVPTDWPSWRDPGVVAFVELDTGGAEPMVVWIVDVPSDPRLWRQRVMREAHRAVDAWDGPAWVEINGRLVRQDPESAGTSAAASSAGVSTRSVRLFPEPDLVVGDFNTPRGSASVRTLVGDLAEGHASAGRGRNASFWIRFRAFDPGYHIDLAFAGAGARITGYRLVKDPDVRHAMQVVEIERGVRPEQ